MILKMFSVYDSKAEAYMQPFFLNSRGLAIRSFTDLANDPKTSVYQYAADFTLFELGEFDDNGAKIIQHPAPVALVSGHEVKKAPPFALNKSDANFDMGAKS